MRPIWEMAVLTALFEARPGTIYTPATLALPSALPHDVEDIAYDLLTAGCLTAEYRKAGRIRTIDQAFSQAAFVCGSGPAMELEISFKGEHRVLRHFGKDPASEDAHIVRLLLTECSKTRDYHFPSIEGVGKDRLAHLLRFMIREGTLEGDPASVHTLIPHVKISVSGLRLAQSRAGLAPALAELRTDPVSKDPSDGRRNPFLGQRGIVLKWGRLEPDSTAAQSGVSTPALTVIPA